MMNKKFILNCPYDNLSLTRKQIIIKALVWLFILFFSAVLIRIACAVIYMANGINPMELTSFGGDPTSHVGDTAGNSGLGIWKTVLMLLFTAPLLEEILFRLPLSFRKNTVALWLGLIPLIIAYYFYYCEIWYVLLGLAVIGAGIYFFITRSSKDEQFALWKGKYITLAMWVSAIGFGIIHLIAFSVLNLQILPWALATILIPMAGGCAITYARVNLGFFWGVLLHMLINIPAILVIIATSING